MANETPLSRFLRSVMPGRGFPLDGPRAGGIARLADESGISRASLSRIVNGQSDASIDALRKLGAVLGFSLAEMMLNANLASEHEVAPPPPEPRSTPERLGRVLFARRSDLHPGVTRRDFAVSVGLDDARVRDLEAGLRPFLAEEDIEVVERIYELQPGSVTKVLETGDVSALARNLGLTAERTTTPALTTEQLIGQLIAQPPDDASDEQRRSWCGYPPWQRLILALPGLTKGERDRAVAAVLIERYMQSAEGAETGNDGRQVS